MPDPDIHSERLNNAIDALLAGRDASEVRAGLPEGQRWLVTVAARLAGARRAVSDGPRATFVLGLEEQLRADLRLGGAPTLGRSWSRHAARWVVVAVVGAAVFVIGAMRSGPADPLYAVRRVLEAGELALAPSGAARCARNLDLGWDRLEALDRLDPRGGARADPLVRRLLAELVANYAAAVDAAAVSGDARTVRLAQTELTVVRESLTRMTTDARTRDLAGAAVFADALDQLEALAVRIDRLAAVDRAPAASVAPTPTTRVEARFDDPPSVAPPAVASPVPPPAATRGVTEVPVTPVATQTPVVATSVPAQPPERPIEPPATALPLPTVVPEAIAPSPSAAPLPERPSPAPPTATPDRWPTTPPEPRLPTPGAAVPTAGPPLAAPPGNTAGPQDPPGVP